MIFTTTDVLDGDRPVAEYLGVVVGKSVRGIVFTRDIFAKARDIFGGRVRGYEKELDQAFKEAFEDLVETANKLGADAVLGLRCAVESVGEGGKLLLVSFIGTAVKLGERREKP